MFVGVYGSPLFLSTVINTVYITTYCRNLDLLYGSTLVFDTIRIGFPDSNIIVIDNASIPVARDQIRLAAESIGAYYYQEENEQKHNHILARIFNASKVPFAIVDPDIIFWDRFDQTGGGLMEGRLIPTFCDPYSQCLTHSRLHTSLLKVASPDELRAEIKKYASFFEFDPIAPIMFYRGGWERYDTLGSLYSVAEDCRAFTPAELDCYDHLFCGSHIDLVADKLGEYSEQVLASHQMAKDGNYKNLKGIWRLQEQFFKTLAPK